MKNNNHSSLVEDFQTYFDLELAISPAQLASVYQIRYRVYCDEFQYEQANAFPNKQESDAFDAHSIHCLVRHKATGLPAGCARVVAADAQSLLPMEKFCASALNEETFRTLDNKRDTICEFSRLAVDSTFRRRPGEGASRFGEITSLDCSQRELRTFSMIAVATVLSAFAISDLIDRPHCFAMMEPFLPRLLRRSGFVVNPAGDAIEYHGTRTPFYLETGEAVIGMADELQDFYQAILASFAQTGHLSGDSVAPAASAVRRDYSAPLVWPLFAPPVFAV